jgi:hypothetical protein
MFTIGSSHFTITYFGIIFRQFLKLEWDFGEVLITNVVTATNPEEKRVTR